jgi:hypothetical protein
VADPRAEADAYAAAERLVREAHARAEAAARAAAAGVPPGGYRAAGEEPADPFGDLAALAGLLEAARGALPPELARQLADALRDLLLALRAVIDYSLARLERPAAPPAPEVVDIPVE